MDVKKRVNVKCAKCKSQERTRLLWMYIQRLSITPKTRVLHLAPERAIYRQLSKLIDKENYIVADYDPARYSFVPDCQKIDLCDLGDWPSNSYDFIIHSHVMEHTPCNIAYTLFHLHRMLRPEGRHMCIIPFMRGYYDETFADIGDDERRKRFGQHDHVRRYGTEDIDRHLGKLITLPENFDATRDFAKKDLDKANIPEALRQGFTTATVLNLGKYDMKLLAAGT